MDTDPLDPIRVLGQKVAEIARMHGLELEVFLVMPDLREGDNSDYAQAIFRIGDDALKTAEEIAESRATDEQFKAMMLGEQVQARKDAVDNVRAGGAAMLERIANLGINAKDGIGLDDAPTPPEPEKLPYVVGEVAGGPEGWSRRFATEQEAAEYISTLPDHLTGKYYLDGPADDY